MARKKIRVKRKGHWRKAYTTSTGKRVSRKWIPPTTYMIADRGRPGRGPATIKIKKEGALGGPGYAEKSAARRHTLLRRSVRRSGYDTTAARIAAVRGLGKRTMSKHDLKIFARDQRWLKREFGKKKTTTKRRRRSSTRKRR